MNGLGRLFWQKSTLVVKTLFKEMNTWWFQTQNNPEKSGDMIYCLKSWCHDIQLIHNRSLFVPQFYCNFIMCLTRIS